MSGTGWEVLWQVRNGSGGPSAGPKQVGWSSRGLRRVGGPYRMFGTGRGTLPEIQDSWETLWEVRDWLGDPPKGPGQVGGPSQRSEIGSGDSPEVPRRVG